MLLDIDDCIINPCNNNGTCTDGIASYTCDCPLGFTGLDCETSTKILMLIIVTQHEMIKFTPLFLISDIDDCLLNPCTNNGTCIDGISSFSCNCAHGFIGKECATSKLCYFYV